MTLVEVLVSVAIFSMVVASVMRFGDYVLRRIVTVRSEVDQLDQMVLFLKQFSIDVRDSRQILYTTPVELGIWRIDDNADSAPEAAETLGYAWNGESPGVIYRQAGDNRTTALSDVRDLRFQYDRESPLTRHVMLEVEVGKTAVDIRRYHFSVNLRASELH